jgi:phosphohistidine phosphatase
MKELFLLRHAKAKVIKDGMEDKDRQLKKRGKLDAKNIGQWLKKQHLIPDAILSSPAVRTIETVKIIYEELQVNSLVIQEDARLYATDIEQLKTVLATCPETTKRVLLVGHNPELEQFLKYIVGKDALPNVKKLLPTAALVILSLDNMLWSELGNKRARFSSIIHAKSLLE